MCINNSKYNQLKCSPHIRNGNISSVCLPFLKSLENVYSPPSHVHHSPLLNVSICVLCLLRQRSDSTVNAKLKYENKV